MRSRPRPARPTVLCVVGVLLASCTGAAVRTPKTVRAGADRYRSLIQRAAQQHGVDASLVMGVVYVESRFRPNLVSRAGARGLMQLMPRTAAGLAEKLGWQHYDVEQPEFNINAGTYYLASLLRSFDGNATYALAAYNAGPARVRRWRRNGIPLPSHSRRYVARVIAAQRRLRADATPSTPGDVSEKGGTSSGPNDDDRRRLQDALPD